MMRNMFAQLLRICMLTVFALGTPGVSGASALQASARPAADAGTAELTFEDMGFSVPADLTGPISEVAIPFNLPIAWQPTGSVAVDVDLSAFFSSIVPSENTSGATGVVGGTLSISVNGKVAHIATLQNSGDQTLHVEFPATLLQPAARTRINEMRFRWDATVACQMNLLSSVTILPASRMHFEYASATRTLSLNDFPVPFYTPGALRAAAIAVVMPPQPSAAELRAGLIVVAGLGRISGGKSDVQLLTADKYLPRVEGSSQIVIASREHLGQTALASLGAPSPVATDAESGTLTYFESKGMPGILVTGDDAGLVKAAQALSTGKLIASGDGRSMVVPAVTAQTMEYGAEDVTLAELGQGDMVFTAPDRLEQSFTFQVPAGQQARADAAFNLVLSHSQQLDYLRSGLQLELNGYPVTNLRLSDSNSNGAVFNTILPSNLIKPGLNTATLVAELGTRDLCTPPTADSVWISVSAGSVLHLPLEAAQARSVPTRTFSDFPKAWVTSSDLGDSLFVLSPANADALAVGGQLALQVGAALGGDAPISLEAAYANGVDADAFSRSSSILIGKTTDFATIVGDGAFPALKFEADGTLTASSPLQLVTQPPSGMPLGYLAIRGFDQQPSRIVLAVIGDSSSAMLSAGVALAASDLQQDNFAYVASADTTAGWLDASIAGARVGGVVPTPEPAMSALGTAAEFRAGLLPWVIPSLVLLVALAGVLIFGEAKAKS